MLKAAIHALFVYTLLLLPLPAAAAEPSLNGELDAYLNVFFLAEGKLPDFDRELDHALLSGQRGFLAHSSAYHDLSALRAMRDSRARSLAELYKKNPAERENFLSRLQALDPAERIAGHDLVTELRNTDRGVPVFYASLGELLAARAAARAITASHITAAGKDKALLEEMRALAATLDFSAARKRGAAPVQPSPGANGTINGAGFPDYTWALTYDDGPSGQYTPMVLANLAEYKKKASFLWLVECVEQFRDLPAKAHAAGMPTNNHSWTHLNLDTAKQEALNKEITAATERETQLYGERPRFFRLPYGAGASNKNVRQMIADNGMIHVGWNVDSLDWQDKDPNVILERVKKAMALEKHGIILFHDIHPQSVEASKLVLKYSATLDHGAHPLRWVTIPEIVDELNHRNEISYLKKPAGAKTPVKRASLFPLDHKRNLR